MFTMASYRPKIRDKYCIFGRGQDMLGDVDFQRRRRWERVRQFEDLTRFVLLVTCLKDARDLRVVLEESLQVALPDTLRDVAMELLERKHVPDKAEISRAQLSLDVGFMIFQHFANCHRRAQYTRSLAWDSSPQGGRDYELAILRSIKKASLSSIFRLIHQLYHMWGMINHGCVPWMRFELGCGMKMPS
jgi:hypothetical protein